MRVKGRLNSFGDIVTYDPPQRIGPIHLVAAIRLVVERRPKAERVEIQTWKGEVLSENEIMLLYEGLRLPN